MSGLAVSKTIDSCKHPLFPYADWNKHKSNLDVLPPELLVRIFSFLREKERIYGGVTIYTSVEAIQEKDVVREVKEPVKPTLVCKKFVVINNMCRLDELINLERFIHLIIENEKTQTLKGSWQIAGEAAKQAIAASTPTAGSDLVIVKENGNAKLTNLVSLLRLVKDDELMGLTEFFTKMNGNKKEDREFSQFALKVIALSKGSKEWYKCVEDAYKSVVNHSWGEEIPEHIAQNMYQTPLVPKLSHSIQFISSFYAYDKLTTLKVLAKKPITNDRVLFSAGFYSGYLYASVAFLIFKERGLVDSLRYQLTLEKLHLNVCIILLLIEFNDSEDVVKKFREESSNQVVKDWLEKVPDALDSLPKTSFLRCLSLFLEKIKPDEV